MKNKRFIRLTLSVLLMITLLCSFNITAFAAAYPDFATGGYTEGDSQYDASVKKTADGEYILPIYLSQAYHTRGYATTIGVTEAHSKTWEGGDKITVGYNGIFLSLAAEVGVAQETSHSVAITVSYTISEEKDSGYYRIEMRCPKFSLREILLETTERGTVTAYSDLLPDMPGLNAGYHILVRYQ